MALGRNTKWRQGDILPEKAALQFYPELAGKLDEFFVVVISHHCDLAADESKEPDCEVIIGKKVSKLGKESNSKMARRLQIEYRMETDVVYIELRAIDKRTIGKEEFLKYDPRKDMRLDGRGIGILRNWLGSRYNREAFPEMFDRYMKNGKASGKKAVPERIEEILDSAKDHIKMLLFEVDDGVFQERDPSGDPYELGISVIYESEIGEDAMISATRVAKDLEDLFETAFEAGRDRPYGIELIYCDEVSDEAISVARRAKLQEWKLDHLSF